MEQQNTPVSTSPNNNDTMAFVAYITIFGFLIAILTTNNSERSELLKFHLRQVLGLFLTGFALSVVAMIPLLGWVIAPILALVLIVFLIMGLVSALNKEMKPVPLLGAKYQEWFANAF